MRPLRVVIADGGGTARAVLIRLAGDSGLELVGEAPTWDGICDLVTSRAADLVLISGSPDFARGLGVLAGEVASAVVAPDAQSAKEYGECGAFVVLTPEVEPEIVAVLATTAVARASDLRAARQEADNLRGMLETRKVVERAKGVLMRRLGVSEDAAYRRMQKASQDENRKMKDIADSILSAERLYGDGDQPQPDA
ncbi:MAG TPA: ANTAR domain-containing protein [Actinomycetota bacterium]|nr:ANTAR domain-containing protein [Actinomycetota bacterium]